MLLMAAFLAPLTDPVDIACFAGKIVVFCLARIVLSIAQSKTFQRFIALKLYIAYKIHGAILHI